VARRWFAVDARAQFTEFTPLNCITEVPLWTYIVRTSFEKLNILVFGRWKIEDAKNRFSFLKTEFSVNRSKIIKNSDG
jgi:hypothetical protein